MPADQPAASRSLPLSAPPPAYRPEANPAPAQRSPARGEKNKWIAILLCLFFGVIGLHKFYEERIGMGILYLLTGGLFGIGWFVDLIVLLFRPNPYYP